MRYFIVKISRGAVIKFANFETRKSAQRFASKIRPVAGIVDILTDKQLTPVRQWEEKGEIGAMPLGFRSWGNMNLDTKQRLAFEFDLPLVSIDPKDRANEVLARYFWNLMH